MTMLVIVNPMAGGGKALRLLPELRSRFSDPNMSAKILISEYHRHAVKLAEDGIAEGFRQIVSVGGDGTLHEIVEGIMSSGKSAEVLLGVIPIGGGNDFCRSLGITFNLKQNLEILKQGKVRQLDLGKVQNTHFVNSMGAGFDAVIARKAERARYLPGRIRYIFAILSSLLHLKSYHVRIESDGEIRVLKALMISIGNGSFCGRGFKLCPHAEQDDGKLDLCIVEALPLNKILFALPSVMKGTHLRFSFVSLRQVRHIQIVSPSDLPIYCDGELPDLNDKRRIEISIIPKGLKMICP